VYVRISREKKMGQMSEYVKQSLSKSFDRGVQNLREGKRPRPRYTSLRGALEWLSHVSNKALRERLVTVLDWGNERFIQNLRDQLSLNDQIIAAQDDLIKHLKGLLSFREKLFDVLQKLKRERRVQPNVVEKILSAYEVALTDGLSAIEKHFERLNVNADLCRSYVDTIRKTRDPCPSLAALSKQSGYSRQVWSKYLRKDASLLMSIYSQIKKNINQAKVSTSKDLWIKAALEIEDKIELLANRARRREEPKGELY
jgi:hypothetical protein